MGGEARTFANVLSIRADSLLQRNCVIVHSDRGHC